MIQFQLFTSFLVRLLVTSVMALCIQILLFVRYPDILLEVQEAVKRGSVWGFEQVSMQSSYRVAYNLLNADGILVHTLFVMLSFTVIYILFIPVRYLLRNR